MSRFLSDSNTAELMSVLSSKYVLDVCEGTGTIITAPLTGKAVCAIVEHDGRTYFVVDLEKPLAYRHARQMIREWRAAQYGTVLVGDEPIDLVPVMPEPEGPCLLSHVS